MTSSRSRFQARLRALACAAAALVAAGVAGSARAQGLAVSKTWEGPFDYVVTGATIRTQSNDGGNECLVGTSATATLSGIPAGAAIETAILYWGGSGPTVDNSVTFAGATIAPDASDTTGFANGGTTYWYFGARKDVTSLVTGNGTFTLSNLGVTTTTTYCTPGAITGGWSLFVVYRQAGASAHKLELRDGMRAFQNAAEQVNLTGFTGATTPDARFTVWAYEGDENLTGGGETITFNGFTVSDALNPNGNQFNSTINSKNSSSAYGIDLDTYNVSARLAAGATTATLRVVTGGDMIVLHAVMTIVGVQPRYAVVATPDGAGPTQRLPGTGYPQQFQVANTSTVDATFDILFSGTGNPLFALADSLTGTGVPAGSAVDSVRMAIPFGTTRTLTLWYTVPAGPGATNTGFLRARAVPAPTVFDDASASVQRVSPRLTLAKSVAPSNTLSPGTDLTYTLSFANAGDFAATGVVVQDSVPGQTIYKLGTTQQTLPAGVTAVTEFSQNGTVWTYVPVSAGCGAPAGYDACVRRIRWRLQQALPAGAAASAGTAKFVARIK